MTDVVTIDDDTKHRIEKTDKIFRLSLVGAILIVIIMFVLILVQNQLNANAALKTAAKNAEIGREHSDENHKRTQNYVLCIAKALSLQIPDRTIDQCTQTVSNDTKAVNWHGFIDTLELQHKTKITKPKLADATAIWVRKTYAVFA